MPNGLQMWPNLITGPLCVNTQRAPKWINPTDMFSSPTIPAFKSNNTQWLLQYIISTSADISHPVGEAAREPEDSWENNRRISYGQQIKVSFHKCNDMSPERSKQTDEERLSVKSFPAGVTPLPESCSARSERALIPGCPAWESDKWRLKAATSCIF